MLGRRSLHARRGFATTAAAVLTAAPALGAAPAAAGPPEGVIRDAGAPGTVAGSYLAVLNPSQVKSAPPQGRAETKALAERSGGTVRRTYEAALNSFSVELSERQARRLAADPVVAGVVQNRRVSLDSTNE